MKKTESGFSLVMIVLMILVFGVVALVGYSVFRKKPDKNPDAIKASQQTQNTTPSQQQTQQTYTQATQCNTQPTIQPPVDLSKATSVLYPGQYRGNEYKAHGGFRFDGLRPEQIKVTAPLDGTLFQASRYTQSGDVQIILVFNAKCGITYRFDHILSVDPKFQSAIDALPAPTADSHTSSVKNQITVKAGDTVAIAVGSPSTGNTFVDFGVYDTEHKNKASQNPERLAKHQSNLTDQYGLCWIDLLNEKDKTAVLNLPVGSKESGKTSDYCN